MLKTNGAHNQQWWKGVKGGSDKINEVATNPDGTTSGLVNIGEKIGT